MSVAKNQPWWTYGAFRVQANTKSEARKLLKDKRGEKLPKKAVIVKEEQAK